MINNYFSGKAIHTLTAVLVAILGLTDLKAETILDKIGAKLLFLETPQGVVRNPFELYHDEKKKWVAFFSAKLPTNFRYASPEFTLSIDLADFTGLTEEGRNGWVTVWLEPAVVGRVRSDELDKFANLGIELREFDPLRPDQRTKWVNLSLSAGEFFEVSIDDGRPEFEVDAPLTFQAASSFGDLTNGSYSSLDPDFSIDFSGAAFEIRIEALNRALTTAFVDGAPLTSCLLELINVLGDQVAGRFNWRDFVDVRYATNDDGVNVVGDLIRRVGFENTLVYGIPNAFKVTLNLPEVGSYRVRLRTTGAPLGGLNWDWENSFLGEVNLSVEIDESKKNRDQILRFPVIPTEGTLRLGMDLFRGIPQIGTGTIGDYSAYEDTEGLFLTTNRESFVDAAFDENGREYLSVRFNQPMSINFLNSDYYQISRSGLPVPADFIVWSPSDLRIFPNDDRPDNTEYRLDFVEGRRDLFGRTMDPGFKIVQFTTPSIVEAYSPSPSNGANGIEAPVMLQWMGDARSEGYRVLLKINEDWVTIGEPAVSQLAVTIGRNSGTFLWRVDSLAFDGSVVKEGPVWTFTVGDDSNQSGYTVQLTASPANVPVDGQSVATLTARVTHDGVPLQGVHVSFSRIGTCDGGFATASGTFLAEPNNGLTDAAGQRVTYYRPRTAGDVCQFQATSGGASDAASFEATFDSGAVITLELSPRITNGVLRLFVEADVIGASGAPVDEGTVRFSTNFGTFVEGDGAPGQVVTDEVSSFGSANTLLNVDEDGIASITAEFVEGGATVVRQVPINLGEAPLYDAVASIAAPNGKAMHQLDGGTNYLIAAEDSEGLGVWDMRDLSLVRYWDEDDFPNVQNWWRDPNSLGIADDDNRIVLCEVGDYATFQVSSPSSYFITENWAYSGDEDLDVAPSGNEWLGVVDGLGSLELYDNSGARVRVVEDAGDGNIRMVAYSPDGSRVAYTMSDQRFQPYHTLLVIRSTSNWTVVRRILMTDGQSPSSVAWSPDSKHVAACDGDILRIYDRDGGQPSTVVSTLLIPEESGGIDWSPDGNYLAAHLEGNQYAVVLDVTTGATVARLNLPGGDDGVYRTLAWSPDSQALFGTYYGSTRIRVFTPFDTVSPEILGDWLEPEFVVDGASVELSGMVSDNVFWQGLRLWISVNGSAPVEVSLSDGGEFRVVAELLPGLNEIGLRLVDGMGNSVEEVLSVSRNVTSILVDSSGVSIPEGSEAQVSFVLSRKPINPVSVSVSRISGDSDISVAGEFQFNFDESNWAAPQFVVFQALDDTDAIDGASVFEFTAPGLTPAQLLVVESDDDRSFEIPVFERYVPDEGGAFEILIQAVGDWSWSKDVDWILLDEDASQTGDGVLAYVVEPNVGTARIGSITFDYGGKLYQHTVYQASLSVGKVTDPMPPSGAVDQPVESDVSWVSGANTVGFRVYFGTDAALDSNHYQGEQTGTTFDPGTLAKGATYHWRVDAKNSSDEWTIGDVWRFTTEGDETMGEVVLFEEDFDDGTLDEAIIVATKGTFSVDPGIKDNAALGGLSFGFGKSTVPGNAFNNYQTELTVDLGSCYYITKIEFKEREEYDWGSYGGIYLDGEMIHDLAIPTNTRSDRGPLTQSIPLAMLGNSITFLITDITNASEVFLDDIVITGRDLGVLTPFQEWLCENGLDLDPAGGGWNGIGSLLTYALGIDPIDGLKEGESSPIPFFGLAGDQAGIGFMMPVDPPVDVRYIVEESCDLAVWKRVSQTAFGGTEWAGTSTPVIGVEDPFGRREIVIPSLGTVSEYPLCFMRLKVEIFNGGETPNGFALVPGGGFTMGDSVGEGDADELPLHSVDVSAFYIGEHEVTKRAWDEVRDWALDNGYPDLPVGGGREPDHPVHSISWYSMIKWCNARSERDGLAPCYTVDGSIYRIGETVPVCDWNVSGYRLPSEAEWEKAARGGEGGWRFPWGDDAVSASLANYGSLRPGALPKTAPVGSFAPNSYGLYDMAGNVWEWCWDWYSADYYGSSPATDPRGPSSGTVRVARGGGWDSIASHCRVASRRHDVFNPSATRYNGLGFRVVRGLAGSAALE